MMSLFADWQRYSRQLSDLKTHNGKAEPVFLAHEFFACAFAPALQTHPLFAEIFGEDESKIRRFLEFYSWLGTIEAHYLAFDYVYASGKDKFDQWLASEIQVRKEASKGLTIRDLGVLSPIGDTDEDIKAEIREEGIPAYRLSDLIKAMNRAGAAYGISGTFSYEARCFFAGDEKKALAFWRQVSKLDDYSQFFLSRPPDGERQESYIEAALAKLLGALRPHGLGGVRPAI